MLRVVVADRAALDNVDDIGVVPDRGCVQVALTNFHPQQRVAGSSIHVHPVQTNKRPLVGIKLRVGIGGLRRCSGISNADLFHRVGINADDRTAVIGKIIVNDNRLCSANKNRRGIVGFAVITICICAAGAVCVEFKE